MSHYRTWLGPACRAGRAWVGWNAADLAPKVHLSLKQIQRIESGSSIARPETLQAIVQVFAAENVEISPQGLRIILPKGATGEDTLTLKLPIGLLRAMDGLIQWGIFGDTPEKVAEALINRALQDLVGSAQSSAAARILLTGSGE